MGFLKSDEVKVYPSTRRQTVNQPDARPVTEYQLVSLVNRLVGNVTGFVITQPENFSAIDGWIEFNIHGYYFKAEANAIVSAAGTGNQIYAHIWLDNVTRLIELYGQDDTTTGYSGVYFSNSGTRPTGVLEDGTSRNDLEWYSLLLMEKDSNNIWKVPAASLSRFSPEVMPTVTPEHLSITEISGGTLSI